MATPPMFDFESFAALTLNRAVPPDGAGTTSSTRPSIALMRASTGRVLVTCSGPNSNTTSPLLTWSSLPALAATTLLFSSRSIESPVAASSPMYFAGICLPSGPMTDTSGPSKKPLTAPGNIPVEARGDFGGRGAAGNATTGGPNSTSASGNQAAIVSPSSIASPAMTLV